MLISLPKTKYETYVSFEFEKKELNEICLQRGLAKSTLYGHLESAILIGLPVSFNRLDVKPDDISTVEKRIRQPPINSSM